MDVPLPLLILAVAVGTATRIFAAVEDEGVVVVVSVDAVAHETYDSRRGPERRGERVLLQGGGGDVGGRPKSSWTPEHNDDKVDNRRSCEIAGCECDDWKRAGVSTGAPRPWLRPEFQKELMSPTSSSVPMDGSPPGMPNQRMPTDGSSREDLLYNNFLKYCGCNEAGDDEVTCHGFISHYLAFGKKHRAFVEEAHRAHAKSPGDGASYEGSTNKPPQMKVLVIRSNWHALGLGHMAPTAALWLQFALVSDRLLFFDSRESKFDWTDYFEAWFGEETPGLDLAFTPAIEAHLKRLGYKETVDDLGGEVFYEEQSPTSAPENATRCDVGHCRSYFFCTKHEMEQLSDHELEKIRMKQEAEGENEQRERERGGGGDMDSIFAAAARHHAARGGQCTSELKRRVCAMGTIPLWECDACLQCVSDHVENARWLTIKGPGVKPPTVAPSEDAPMFGPRLHFWDAAARNAGTEELLETIRKNPDRCTRCGIYSLIRPKFVVPVGSSTSSSSTTTIASKTPHPRWVSFFRTPYAAVGFTRGLACLKVRTGYSENKLCFPDEIKPTQKCMDGIYATPPCADAYNNHMAVRLQYKSVEEYSGEGGESVESSLLPRKTGLLTGELQTRVVGMRESIKCMRRILGRQTSAEQYWRMVGRKRSWAADRRPFIHLITDTPAIQRFLIVVDPASQRLSRINSSSNLDGGGLSASRGGTGVTAFSGVGVDLTNTFRDDQDDRMESKWKVAFDYYIQAWCDESVTLSPSEFYSSAEYRTLATQPVLVGNTCTNSANDYLTVEQPKRLPRDFTREEALSMRKFWDECAVNIEDVKHTLHWGLVFDFGFDIVEHGRVSKEGWDKVGGKYLGKPLMMKKKKKPPAPVAVAASTTAPLVHEDFVEGLVEGGAWEKSGGDSVDDGGVGLGGDGGDGGHLDELTDGGHVDDLRMITVTSEEKEETRNRHRSFISTWWFIEMAMTYAGGLIAGWCGYALVQRRRRLRAMGTNHHRHHHGDGGARHPIHVQT